MHPQRYSCRRKDLLLELVSKAEAYWRLRLVCRQKCEVHQHALNREYATNSRMRSRKTLAVRYGQCWKAVNVCARRRRKQSFLTSQRKGRSATRSTRSTTTSFSRLPKDHPHVKVSDLSHPLSSNFAAPHIASTKHPVID